MSVEKKNDQYHHSCMAIQSLPDKILATILVEVGSVSFIDFVQYRNFLKVSEDDYILERINPKIFPLVICLKLHECCHFVMMQRVQESRVYV